MVLALMVGSIPALAHGGGDVASGFSGGFARPLFGPDHAAAMVAVAGSDAIAFSAGFVVATGLLHLCGIEIGATTRRRAGRIAVRLAGGAIAIAGIVFLRQAVL
jgi:hydrogenase/urease accessory protein HupE